jgi:Rubisco accumulation factor 1 alpha helical domain/Rubisco Assembly chaperone C-terminal domain/Rubisco accumulation factor 1 helix turn helix domain
MIDNTEELLHKLRRKEGTWPEWGQWLQQLQKSGHNTQAIFEATGFEPIHQNQITVGSQVYTTIINVGIAEATKSYFDRKGSDILYELRILNQKDRAQAADFIVSRNLDLDAAKEVAKAVKDFSFLGKNIPEGFTNHTGDAVAYQYWRLAKQKNDLQEKSRLIARGLMFAYSNSARQQIEGLLLQMTNRQKTPPTLPFYRFEYAEYLPKLLPVVGNFPVTKSDLSAVNSLQPEGTFQIIKYSGNQSWVSLPGWPVLLKSIDPVAIIGNGGNLPNKNNLENDEFLFLVDREGRDWDENSYFLVENEGNLLFKWLPEPTDKRLFGKLILVLLPKKILDEELTADGWEIEE